MIQQGSPEWHQARLGKATASRIADVITRTKSGYSTSRANYEAELIVERLTGTEIPKFTSAAMLHGIETEPQARDAYAFMRDCDVDLAGFVEHPTIPMAGASPDGLVGEHGLVEAKCPITATHIATLLTGAIPGEYLTQMYWQMACTGRKWVDYISFDPRLPARMQLFIKRVERDNARIAELEKEVRSFLDGVTAKIAELEKAAAA